MKNTLNNKILKLIEEKNYKPKSRFFFIFLEVLIWIGITISLFLASLATGSFIFQIFNKDLIPSNVNFIFIIIRILFIIIFIILFVYQIRRTNSGYRKKLISYILVSILSISALGSFIFISNAGGKLDINIGNYGVYSQAKKYWSQPKNTGLLAGELVEVSDNGYLIFKSLDNKIHIIDPSSLSYDEYSLFLEFLYVKMIGYENNDIYYPCVVSPWRIRNLSGGIHPEYRRRLYDNNLNFLSNANGDNYLSNQEKFKYFFERKSDIIRSNVCR